MKLIKSGLVILFLILFGMSKNAYSQSILDPENYITLKPTKTWIISENPNPKYNFALNGIPVLMGDVNGDGINDYSIRATAKDERTPTDLSDETFKTAVYYGGNFSQEPNELHYQYLVPIGDINGDGYDEAFAATFNTANSEWNILYGSNNGLEYTGVDFGWNRTITSTFTSFLDFNGDGFEDIIFSCDKSTCGVVTGAEEPSGVSGIDYLDFATNLEDYSIDGSLDNSTVRAAGDLNGNGMDEIVILVGGENEAVLGIFEYDTGSSSVKTVQIIRDLELNTWAQNTNLGLFDIDGDSVKEIFIGQQGAYIFKFSNDSMKYNSSPFKWDGQFNPIPAGDLNSDERMDFFVTNYEGDGKPYIAFGPASIETGISPDFEITGFSENEDWGWSIGTSVQYIFGDINGDGVDDAIIGHSESNSKTVGRRILLGGTPVETQFTMFEKTWFTDRVNEVISIGDFNDDSFEDFAFARYDRRTLDIYWGGVNISDKPNETINLEYAPRNIINGDFNNDGKTDLLVGDQAAQNPKIYFGGTNYSTIPDIEFSYELLEDDENTGLYYPKNIGDINDDGTEDIIFSNLRDKIFVFYGGANLSAVPNKIINLAEKAGINGNSGLGRGAASIGDVNADGIDDFAIGAAYVQNENNTIGKVLVFFGSSESEFEMTEIILPDSLSGVQRFGYYVNSGGDINNDGMSDIIVTSILASENEEHLIAIIYGGEVFDEFIDQYYGVPGELTNSVSINNEGYSTYGWGDSRFVDINNDGDSEILFVPSTAQINPILFPYDSSKGYVFESPNQGETLGNIQTIGNSAIGDFNNDGNMDFIFPQPEDDNDAAVSSRVYMYSVPVKLGEGLVNTVPYLVEVPDTIFIGEAGITINESFAEYFADMEDSFSDLMVDISVSPSDITLEVDLESKILTLSSEEYVGEGLLEFVVTDPKGLSLEFSIVLLVLSDTGIEDSNTLPKEFSLQQNFPNPFNPSSTIRFGIPEATSVSIEVFNSLGQRVALLVNNKRFNQGWHSVNFDARNLASGVYIYRIHAGEFVQTKRMMLIK